jgi:ubiquinone/menaquinone biosynthesis C-methylase UbiE
MSGNKRTSIAVLHSRKPPRGDNGNGSVAPQPHRHTAAEEPPQADGSAAQHFMDLHFGFAPARILSAALELGVFDHIAGGSVTAGKIAHAAGASERGMCMLLDALVGIGFLTKTDARYRLTDGARRHLVSDRPEYLGDFLSLNALWDAWGNLTESVRTGKPYRPLETKEVAEDFFPKLIRSLHVVHAEPARRAAQVLGAGTTSRGMRVLDLACGSAIWSISVAEADQYAHVTAVDFPRVLEMTREFLKRHRMETRFDFRAGDLKSVDLGAGRYDLAILGNIVHSEGERSSRNLLRRVYKALAPEGRIVILDMIPNNERTSPAFPLIFALNMLVGTTDGGTYTFAEYDHWLTEAGFQRVETRDIGYHSPMIIGYKA